MASATCDPKLMNSNHAEDGISILSNTQVPWHPWRSNLWQRALKDHEKHSRTNKNWGQVYKLFDLCISENSLGCCLESKRMLGKCTVQIVYRLGTPKMPWKRLMLEHLILRHLQQADLEVQKQRVMLWERQLKLSESQHKPVWFLLTQLTRQIWTSGISPI